MVFVHEFNAPCFFKLNLFKLSVVVCLISTVHYLSSVGKRYFKKFNCSLFNVHQLFLYLYSLSTTMSHSLSHIVKQSLWVSFVYILFFSIKCHFLKKRILFYCPVYYYKHCKIYTCIHTTYYSYFICLSLYHEREKRVEGNVKYFVLLLLC